MPAGTTKEGSFGLLSVEKCCISRIFLYVSRDVQDIAWILCGQMNL